MSNSSTHELYHEGLQACQDHASVPCARAIVSGILAIVTCIACIMKLAHLHKAKDLEPYFILIFILALGETALLGYKWIIWGNILMHFVALYLHVIQFLVLCVYYCRQVLKVRKQRHLINWICYPVASVVFVYFTVAMVLAVRYQHSDAVECRSVAWMCFSAAEMALAAMFILAGLFLTRSLHKFPTARSSQASWKMKTLWSLIGAYTFSAILDFSFDLVYYIRADAKTSCDAVYGEPESAAYTAYKLTVRLSLLVPLWVMLSVLRVGSKRAFIHVQTLQSTSTFATNASVTSLGSNEMWDDDAVSYNAVPDDHETQPLLGVNDSGWQQTSHFDGRHE
eukprot:m.8830 g.8830  ORF g.8830 m.8830 type:complete len:338 (+) comp6761_c0_seq1:178-1191(+)